MFNMASRYGRSSTSKLMEMARQWAESNDRALSRVLSKPTDVVRPLGVLAKDSFRGRRECLAVRAFVHDRITLVRYAEPLALKVPANRLGKSTGAAGGTHKFRRCREFRRQFKCGGRWRELPLKTSFTTYGKNMVRDAAHLIEHWTNGTGFFLTLTWPGSTQDSFDVCSAASGYIADRLLRWLRYKVEGSHVVYVWEVQKRGAPHLHLMFRMSSRTNFSQFYKDTRAQWRNILLDLSKESGLDMFSRGDGTTWRDRKGLPEINFKVVTGRYAAYISKYISKSDTKSGSQRGWHPRRWWGVTNCLRDEVLKRRVKVVLTYPDAEGASVSIQRLLALLSGTDANYSYRSAGGVDEPEILSMFTHDKTAAAFANVLVDWFRSGDHSVLYTHLETYINRGDSS